MRSVAIVGAGHAGLQLGISLLREGYRVTMVSARSGKDIRFGGITSSQLMFGQAIATERELGLNLWDSECPRYTKTLIGIIDDYQPIAWYGSFEPPAQSVDQRLKVPAWLEIFESLGGDLKISTMEVSGLEALAQQVDLVIVAAGRGTLGQLFNTDYAKSPFSTAMRATTMIYVKAIDADLPKGGLYYFPGIGEIVWLPALSLYGPCHIVGFGAVPGREMDVFGNFDSNQCLAASKFLLARFLPQYGLAWQSMVLTDDGATMTAAITPVVKVPVGYLPSGKPVLGIGDAIVLNDPIAAQGSNNAAKAANHYANRIAAHGDHPFDVAWMQETFDALWKDLQWSVALSNALLLPMPEHVRRLFSVAQQSTAIRRTIVGGFDKPAMLFPWIQNAEGTDQYIREHSYSQ